MALLPFSGAEKCARLECPNRAYYAIGTTYWCGVHSKRDAAKRRDLPKDPEAKTKRLKMMTEHQERALVVPLGAPKPGRVRCYRMLMMRQVPFTERWLNILPNNKATGRTDGKAFPMLSPMRLGPVIHRQPGLPPSLNCENYHQGNKCWSSEVDANGDPSAIWKTRRLEMYQDPEPHRHKFDAEQMKKERAAVPNQQNRNQALYSVHLTLNGEERRFTYVESRYFYCCAYEILAQPQHAFQQLLEWHYQGVDVQLCGYDAFDMGINADAETLYTHYMDPAKPFGHERCLYALLMLQGHEKPWHRYRREHPIPYTNIAHMI